MLKKKTDREREKFSNSLACVAGTWKSGLLGSTTSKHLPRRLGAARQPGVDWPNFWASEKALLRREALGTIVLGTGRTANTDVAKLFFPK